MSLALRDCKLPARGRQKLEDVTIASNATLASTLIGDRTATKGNYSLNEREGLLNIDSTGCSSSRS
eukprot:16445477-Heterocapsa_arctica.AAC.1